MAKGLCGLHYQRDRREQDMDAPIKGDDRSWICIEDDCNRLVKAGGRCQTHYNWDANGMDMSAPVQQVITTKDPAEKLRIYAPERGPDECWDWVYPRKQGEGAYPDFWIDGVRYRAHVLAWELANNRKVPDGLVVRHRCDRPICSNHFHLVIGTKAQNTEDMFERGRDKLIGEKNASAKLTDRDVIEIRERYAAGGILQRELAEIYGVSKWTILDVVNRKRWKHI